MAIRVQGRSRFTRSFLIMDVISIAYIRIAQQKKNQTLFIGRKLFRQM